MAGERHRRPARKEKEVSGGVPVLRFSRRRRCRGGPAGEAKPAGGSSYSGLGKNLTKSEGLAAVLPGDAQAALKVFICWIVQELKTPFLLPPIP